MSTPTTGELPAVVPEEAWRAACEDALDAYAHWCAAHPADRAEARAVYLAAAEREAAAAENLRRAAA